MKKEVVSRVDGRQLVDSAISSLEKCLRLVEKLSCKNQGKEIAACAELANCSQQKADGQDETERVILIEPYQDETQMPEIMRMIACELSEPYSIYTYRYFIHSWPGLTFLARDSRSKNYAGVVVCKLDKDSNGYMQGYIAMLAVDVSYRRMGIGTRLVESVIRVMSSFGCDEIVLETEVTNTNAMNLYSRLGFIREKRLFRYYLNGVDAFRLKLFFTIREPCPAGMEPIASEENHDHENNQEYVVGRKLSC